MPLLIPTTNNEFTTMLSSSNNNSTTTLFLLCFYGDFHQWTTDGQMDKVLEILDKKFMSKGISIMKINAEKLDEVADKYQIEVVPTFILTNKNGIVMDKIVGVEPAKVTEMVEKHIKLVTTTTTTATPTTMDSETKKRLFQRIDSLVSSSFVFLFMKGTPQNAKCKFSKRILEIFTLAGITNFGSFDVLSDETIRQGLKEYSQFPTFPQVFAGGKLVGGVDICDELLSEGQLKDVLTPPPPPAVSNIVIPSSSEVVKRNKLETRLTSLITQAPVMLFMKGTPSNPVCGFSMKTVQLLQDAKIEFGSFNILEDDTVREGLKTFSNWPTYPQLYAGGKLIGGFDIVKELAEEGELRSTLGLEGGNL
jgi:Grx4 family monothiol glutaredoxin